MAGFWFDVILIALLIAAIVAVTRLRRHAPSENRETGSALRASRSRAPVDKRRHYYATIARQAGFDPETWRTLYWLAKVLLGALLPLLMLELEAVRVLRAGALAPLLAVAGGVGFVLPDAWLLVRRYRRRQQVSRVLDYFLNLVVTYLHSGLGLEQAFRSAARDGLPPSQPLARELFVVGRELDAGREPTAAFQMLAARTGVAELQGVASALRSGIRLGAPIVGTLQAQADLAWTKRRQTALKRINAAAITIMFPIMLCGFPIFFVLALFPIAVELVDLLIDLARSI